MLKPKFVSPCLQKKLLSLLDIVGTMVQRADLPPLGLMYHPAFEMIQADQS